MTESQVVSYFQHFHSLNEQITDWYAILLVAPKLLIKLASVMHAMYSFVAEVREREREREGGVIQIEREFSFV